MYTEFIIHASLYAVNKQSDNKKPFELTVLRNEIDTLDRELVRLLAERKGIITEITLLKEKHKLPIVQPDRWKEIIANVLTVAENNKLDQELVQDIFKLIHQNSIATQSKGQK
jgi:chorismate mutase